jgi:hypothetical protein
MLILTCSSLLMLALTYLFCLPACRLDHRDVDPTPDHVARLRCVANYLLPPVRAY